MSPVWLSVTNLCEQNGLLEKPTGKYAGGGITKVMWWGLIRGTSFHGDHAISQETLYDLRN
jgi:hypothetical protein